MKGDQFLFTLTLTYLFHPASWNLSTKQIIMIIIILMPVSKLITILVQNPKNYPIAVSSMKASPLSFTFSCKFFIQLVVTVQFSSVTQLCPTLCDPMDCSTPGFPVLHVLWVSDAIQPFHPLSPPSPLALNLSQYQGLFQWLNCSHPVAKVLELQYQSFQRIFRVDIL